MFFIWFSPFYQISSVLFSCLCFSKIAFIYIRFSFYLLIFPPFFFSISLFHLAFFLFHLHFHIYISFSLFYSHVFFPSFMFSLFPFCLVFILFLQYSFHNYFSPFSRSLPPSLLRFPPSISFFFFFSSSFYFIQLSSFSSVFLYFSFPPVSVTKIIHADLTLSVFLDLSLK